MSEPLLRLDSVGVDLLHEGALEPVIHEVSLALDRREVVGLVGESGSGKSMTARAILRLLPPGARTRGDVLLDGDEMPMEGSALSEVRAHRIAMIFQDPRASIDPLYTNEDHITEGLRVHEGMSRRAARARALELLGSVGITDGERVLDSHPGELSGGMLQRIMIAGALAGDPDLLIADEPTTALDVTIQSEILAIFERLRNERGLAILFITHDLEVASAVCDRVLVMYAGRIMEEQQTGELFRAPRHPYSAALLAARPHLGARAEQLATIPGRPPSAFEAIAGCPFHPRCAFSEDQCTTEVPPLKAVEGGASSACRRIAEIGSELTSGVEAGA